MRNRARALPLRQVTTRGRGIGRGIASRIGLVFLLCLPVAAVIRGGTDSREGAGSEEPGGSLRIGLPIERQLTAGEVHRYRLPMKAGDYAGLLVDQLGIDVVVSLVAEDGRRLLELDTPTGHWGIEPLSWIAETEGLYTFEVRASDQDARPGCYAVQLAEMRPASPIDRKRIAAELAFARGHGGIGRTDAPVRRAAVDQLREALGLWRALGDLYQEANTLHTLGAIFAYLGDFQDAIDWYGEAVLVRKAAGDLPGEASTRFLRGTIEAYLARIAEALADYSEALSIEQRLGDTWMEAEIRSNLGRLYDNVGDKERALGEYQRVLSLTRAKGDRSLEARTLSRLASLYESQGSTQEALNYALQSLALSRALGDRQIEATISAKVGRLYTDLAEPEAALRYLEAALKPAQMAADRLGEATVMVDIGRIYATRGELAEALRYYEKALPILRAIGAPAFEARTLISIGQANVAQHDPLKALSSFEQALAVARSAKNPYREAEALTHLGAVHSSRGESGRAFEELAQALEIRRRVRDHLGEAATSYQIARIERDRGDLDASRKLSDFVLDTVESVRGLVLSPELRASFLGSVRAYYEFHIDLLLRLQEKNTSAEFAALALETSERARARSLLDVLVEAGADVRQGADLASLERDHALRRRLNEKLQRQVQLAGAPQSASAAAALAEEIDALTTEIQQLEAEIRRSSPRYAALTQPEPIELAAIQTLLDSETLLLEYVLGAERSFVFAVTRNSLEVQRLPRRSEIERLAKKLYRELARSPGESRGVAAISGPSTELSRLLLAPLAGQLTKKRLVIAADGALQYLPFAFLSAPLKPGSRPTPLLVDHEIVSVPSASVLALLRKEFADRPRPVGLLAVLADPVFSVEDERVRRLRPGTIPSDKVADSAVAQERGFPPVVRDVAYGGRAHLPRLAFSRREARAILDLVPVELRKEALDFAASLATATSEELSRYQYLHFATHGFLDSVHPQLSGLVFSLVDREGKEQNGFLPATEIFNLRLPADLVVLSACQTALGKEIRGEGLIGLTRAFMYAGAPRVVASLWRVDDAATAELMKKFYQGMLGPKKLRPAAALREAQLSVSRQKRWEHPYYWAGFVLQGEWR